MAAAQYNDLYAALNRKRVYCLLFKCGALIIIATLKQKQFVIRE